MRFRNDPAGHRLPVKLDTTTNGEFCPVPLDPVHCHANALAQDAVSENAKRLSMARREFLVSACGVTTSLLSMNAAYARAGVRGGFFEIPKEAALDLELARSAVEGHEFIFDVQGHFINPSGAWKKRLVPGAKPMEMFTGLNPDARCRPHDGPEPLDYLSCYGPDQFIKEVFMDSDTDFMVLSFVPTYIMGLSYEPSTAEEEPLTMEDAVNTARIVEKLKGTHRLFIHGRVDPRHEGNLERMEDLAARYPISAWKTYTQLGPGGVGYWLDDDVGLTVIEKARALGVRNFAVHKGIPFSRQSYEHSTCADVGRVAKRFPDMNFLIYHSGCVLTTPEGPYDPKRTDGIDALCTSLLENGIKPGSNVYAELGSTWRWWMTRDPDSAAHGLGKLFKFCGPDNVLWGTDSIFYGSPQDQIQGFRSFQIAPELRDRYDYPEITPALRAKVFGLNASKIYPVSAEVLKRVKEDHVEKARVAYREQPDPTFQTYGPKTRREFLRLKGWA